MYMLLYYPKWRGAAPIQRSLMAGDKDTGITIMQMDKGLDTGHILCQSIISIENKDTSATIYEKLAHIGQQQLLVIIDKISKNVLHPIPQNNDLASYAHKITKAEGKINWNLSAWQISCHIRGLNPWPIAWTILNDQIIRIWSACMAHDESLEIPGTILSIDKSKILVACGQKTIEINRIQLSGKQIISVKDILNSQKNFFLKGLLFQ